jgi:hypothetical protein
MATITNLQERIEEIAMSKLEADIKDASKNLNNFLSSQKGLFRTGISIKIMGEDDKYVYPYLSQLFDCSPVRDQIVKFNLPEYINKEINSILEK